MSTESIARLRAKLEKAEARANQPTVEVMVSFRIENHWNDRLNEVCRFLGVTRSEYLRQLLHRELTLAAVKQ